MNLAREIPQYPDVTVTLSEGQDGNAFMVIAAVSKAIRRAHGNEAANAFARRAYDAGSYAEMLQLCMSTVNVE